MSLRTSRARADTDFVFITEDDYSPAFSENFSFENGFFCLSMSIHNYPKRSETFTKTRRFRSANRCREKREKISPDGIRQSVRGTPERVKSEHTALRLA
jgi:hypothetical protein